MGKCRYCGGRGYQSVERGSSLSYACEDCGGSGWLPECDICGEEYSTEYCERCYTTCDGCGDVFQMEELENGLCEYCARCEDGE
jgi:hypothetical protein